MMVVMISSHGASWSFHAAAGDKVFINEMLSPQAERSNQALAHLVRECRWLFGDRRIVIFNHSHHEWLEVLHDGAGNIKGVEPYDGPIPIAREENWDE